MLYRLVQNNTPLRAERCALEFLLRGIFDKTIDRQIDVNK